MYLIFLFLLVQKIPQVKAQKALCGFPTDKHICRKAELQTISLNLFVIGRELNSFLQTF